MESLLEGNKAKVRYGENGVYTFFYLEINCLFRQKKTEVFIFFFLKIFNFNFYTRTYVTPVIKGHFALKHQDSVTILFVFSTNFNNN